MKKLLLFAALLPIICSSQNLLEFSEVVQVINTTEKELHDRCLNWFAVSFNNADEVTMTSSDDKIIGKPVIVYKPNVFSGSDMTKGTIKYTFIVEFKDGRYRYSLSDFYHNGNPFAAKHTYDFRLITADEECPYDIKKPVTTKNWRNKVWTDIRSQIDASVLPLIEDLKKSMNTVAAPAKDDW